MVSQFLRNIPHAMLIPYPRGNFSFLSSADFFKNQLFRKIILGIPSECQTDWIQISPDTVPGLICFQSVSKGFEQTTLVANGFKSYLVNLTQI